jgi:DNA-binding NarL/FixJ family response regulator
MPGMNGAEAPSVLRELMPEVPIIVLTMYGDVLGQSMAAGLGLKGVVAKAEGMTKLVECVQRLLPGNSAMVFPQKAAH